MATQQKRFKVTNTTVRAPRINPATKADQRTSIERVGYSVSWKEDGAPNCTVLGPNQLKIVSNITDGMLNLRSDGLIQIEEFGDISEVLKTHATTGKRTTRRGKAPEATPELFTQEGEAPQPAGKREARAAEMGQDTYEQKGGVEYEGAVNPSGDPNFVVRAPSYDARKRLKSSQQTV